MANTDLAFACTCGTVKGTLRDVSPRNGNRLDCYCKDCRAAEVFSAPDTAPTSGPVHLFQTSPDRIEFETGQDQLAVFSLSPNGILRWHAKCCGAMLFNTLRTPKVAFAAFFTDRAADAGALGEVKTRANLQKTDGSSYHVGFRHAALNLAKTAIPARLTGKWKITPFFDVATLNPVADIHVLSKDERAAATPA